MPSSKVKVRISFAKLARRPRPHAGARPIWRVSHSVNHSSWSGPVYLYRADKAGKTVDFYLSRNPDVNAVRAF